MKVRIQHDGQQVGGIHTKVTNAETGELINYVQSVRLDIQATHDPIIAEMSVAIPIVDIIVDAHIKHVCPVCGSDQSYLFEAETEEEKEPKSPYIGQD